MNKYRCETCKKNCLITIFDADTNKKISFNPKDPIESTLWFVQGISQVGCSSHSDFQTNCEKILDNIYRMLKTKSYLIWQSPQSYGQKNVVNWDSIEQLFKKLKKQGDYK